MFLLEALKKHAVQIPERCALITAGERLTYARLWERSEAFASYLNEKHPVKDPVMIYGHKEEDFLCCMIGALKAGRAYIPVDITLPADRAEQIVADAHPCVIVDFPGGGVGADSGIPVLGADALAQLLEEYRGREVSSHTWVAGKDPCYILFTSGSTGRPKGVPIHCDNLTNFAENLYPFCDPHEKVEVYTNQISYAFDVSVVSVYIGLSLGRTLYSLPKTLTENMAALMETLGRSDVGFWVSTPSFAELCVTSALFNGELMPKLHTFLFCGEVLTHKLVDTLRQRFPKARIINTYGPTEATVLVTASEITAEMAADERSIPIGEPLPEVTLLVTDETGKELPEGERGELRIISRSVSEGYFRRPDLTQKVFFETQDAQGKTVRGYRTGDACYRLGNQFYYCGRMDFQIKLNGFRIELEDIESNLMKIDNVNRAVAIPVFDGEKVAYIAAFVSLREPDGLPPLKQMLKIKEAAKAYLPSYMIPRKIVVKDRLPVNTNGKADRKALAAELSRP